jgi:hypothetical protein
VAGVGDGIVAVALPLLATSLTRDPLAIASVVAAQGVPWVAVGALWSALPGDRRTVVGLVNTARAMTLAAVGLLAAIGHHTILGIQLAAMIVGLGEALADRAEAESADVARLSTRGMIGVGLGLALGGFLYEVLPATPFLVDTAVFTLASTFVLLVRVEIGPATSPSHHALTKDARIIAFAAAAAGAAAGAVAGVLVLFALDDLGLGAPAFGVLLAGMAVAAALGGTAAPELVRVVPLRWAIAIAAALAGAGPIVAVEVADPSRPLYAAAALGAGMSGAAAVAVLVRARLYVVTAGRLDAAVMARFRLIVWASAPVGAALGGWLARSQGVPAVLRWSAVGWTIALVANALVRNQLTPPMTA